MNKTSLLLIGTLLIGCVTRSQSRFGLKGGLNLANQIKTISIPQLPPITQDTKSFIGYHLGVFYKTKSHKHFLISGEANFSTIGSGMTLTGSDGKSYDTNEKLGYIELPLTIQYYINKIYFGLGPSIGFMIFSKLTNFENRTFDISHYRTMDAVVNLLAGYSVTNKIDVNLRYGHGFVNIYEDPGYAITKNRFFNLSILFSIK